MHHHAPPFPCVMKELHPSGRARSYPYLDLDSATGLFNHVDHAAHVPFASCMFSMFFHVLRIKMMKSDEICWKDWTVPSVRLLRQAAPNLHPPNLSARRDANDANPTPNIRSAPVGARSATRSAPQTEVKHDMCTTCAQHVFHMCFICVSPWWNCWNMATGH
jgi:hypothetical protein